MKMVSQSEKGSYSSANNTSGWRSRGWTPLVYPKSALVGNEGNNDSARNVYFPLHQDVQLAAVRELLILDETLDGSTLNVSGSLSRFFSKNFASNVVLAPTYSRHLDPHEWIPAAPMQSKEQTRKRKTPPTSHGKKSNAEEKRLKTEITSSEPPLLEVESTQSFRQAFICTEEGEETARLSAEEIANIILLRSRIVPFGGDLSSADELPRTLGTKEEYEDIRPPRKVSDADSHGKQDQTQNSSNILPVASSVVPEDSSDISHFFQLSERTSNGFYVMQTCAEKLPDLLQTSISTESILRDAAVTMTTQLVSSFGETSLRLFLGYKTSALSRERLIRVMAGFLFDVSHAMFAWEQTEHEFAKSRQEVVRDSEIQKSLFDERALRKIGGFDPSSLLPHAISIARLRRLPSNHKNSKKQKSWESFAGTVKGKRMLKHHTHAAGGVASAVITVGKRRRGQRLRQCHWLSSSLTENQVDSDYSTIAAGVRSRSNSFASLESDCETAGTLENMCSRQAKITAEMPCALSVFLVRKAPDASWGVGLAKEGDMCVVGRATSSNNNKADDPDFSNQLCCGDLILHVQNEGGQEACSPICAVSNMGPEQREDWFRAIVNIFKTSQELHLIIQRVGGPVN
jgi:hypothetical protein